MLPASVIGDAAEVACWRARAERAEGRVAELEVRVAELSEQVAVLSRMLFGRSSEKAKPVPDRGAGVEEPDRPGTRGSGDRDEPERKRGQRPGSKGHGRRDYSHLDTREELGEDAEGPAELFRDIAHGGRQEAFRTSLSERGITVATVTSPEGLSEALYQALVKPDLGVGDVSGWRGPVWAVPPLRGDEVARPRLMEDVVAAVTRPGADAVGMTTGSWGVGGSGRRRWLGCWCTARRSQSSSPTGWCGSPLAEDAAGPELAEKVSNVVGLMCGVGLG